MFIMDSDVPTEKSPSPVIMAGLACLISLPVILLATLPMARFHGIHWVGSVLFTLIPLSTAFFTLYRSPWHPEFSKTRRIFSVLASSCLIYCIDLFAISLLIAVALIAITLTRVVGGN